MIIEFNALCPNFHSTVVHPYISPEIGNPTHFPRAFAETVNGNTPALDVKSTWADRTTIPGSFENQNVSSDTIVGSGDTVKPPNNGHRGRRGVFGVPGANISTSLTPN